MHDLPIIFCLAEIEINDIIQDSPPPQNTLQVKQRTHAYLADRVELSLHV